MKITNVKVGTTAFNKVNGLTYKATDVTGTGESKVAIFETIDGDTEEILDVMDEHYDKLEITADSAICFRTLYTPANTEIPDGYSVSDGRLLKDGNPVTEQGQIFVESIIATLPGYLVISVKPRAKKENRIDLFIYDPEKDEFKKLIRSASIPMPTVVKEKDDSVILGYCATHNEPVLDDEGKDTGEQKEVFDEAALMLVRDKTINSVFFDRPMILKLVPVSGSDTEFLIGTTSGIDENRVVSEAKPYYEHVIVEDGNIYKKNLYSQPHDTVASAAVVKIGDGGLILKGKDYILYNDLRITSPLVAQIQGSYLVDVTYGNHETTVTMADDDYNTTSIVRKDTKDRGYIVSIA